MADNTTLNAGAGGDTIATDDIAGVKHQRVKVEFGADGSATDVSTANPLPVDTELPAAAALADAAANPTTPAVGAYGLLWNGTGWDRVRGDITNGLDVDVTRVQGTVTVANAGTFATQAAQSGTWTVQPGNTANTTAWKVDGSAVTQPVSNAGTFATQESQLLTDNAAFTDGTSKVFPAGYIFDEVAGTALTENDVAAGRIDSKRAQVSVIEDATTRGQRATVTASNALKVDGSAVTQPVSYATTGSGTATGALRVELPTNGTGVIATVGAVTAITNALPAGSNAIGKLAANAGVNIGTVDAISSTATPYSLISAASTNATSVKASAGTVFSIDVSNANASPRWFKLYNKASAPTVGTDTPIFRALIPAGGGRTVAFEHGLSFSTGIAFALTTGAADSDTGAVAANEITVNLGYA